MKVLKAIINFLLGLLAVAKWLPFLGKYRQIVIVASTLLSTFAGVLAKCEVSEQDKQSKTTQPTATPESTLTHTPSPSPTPKTKLPEIMLDRVPHIQQPFTVTYTAPFEYNTHLWVDKYRLGYLGRHLDGTHVLYAVVLHSAGKRMLTVRNANGDVLASKMIEVKDGK